MSDILFLVINDIYTREEPSITLGKEKIHISCIAHYQFELLKGYIDLLKIPELGKIVTPVLVFQHDRTLDILGSYFLQEEFGKERKKNKLE